MIERTDSVPSETASDPDETLIDDGSLAEADLLEDDLLVEDVSIDGMCGVY